MDVMDGSNMNNEMNERVSSKGSSKVTSKHSMNSGPEKIPYIRGEVRL